MPHIHQDVLQENSPDTRLRLLEAAVLAFAEHGFDGASIRDIARRANANSAMVQYYFGGKEGLYQAAMRYAFEQGPKRIHHLNPPPAQQSPDARAKAIESLSAYIRNFIWEQLECRGTGRYMNPELERAAMIIWNREMQFPHPSIEEVIKESIQPYVDYLNACVSILRPDLDTEGLYRMGMSIHGQLLFMHNHAELTRLLRGKAYQAEDLDSITEHFTQFSLRGIGVPEAFPTQGA